MQVNEASQEPKQWGERPASARFRAFCLVEGVRRARRVQPPAPAGAGNSPTEVLVATFERLGVPTGIDVQGALAAAEEVVRPFLRRLPFADRGAITQGYAGVYSSFLLHAERAAERYNVPAHEILQRVGEAGYVGGQEDMIIDVALQLAAERDRAGS
jgi:4-hydroxy 2-oxovalerate aldolase